LTNYLTKPGLSCLISSVTTALQGFTHFIDDSLLFFVGDGFSLFRYLRQPGAKINDLTLNHLSSQIVKNFFTKMNIKCYEDTYCNSLDECKVRLAKDIKSGFPVVANVCSAHLVYSSLWTTAERPHFLVIIGLSDDNVLISDVYLSDAFSNNIGCYEGLLDNTHFEKAFKYYNWNYFYIDYNAVKAAEKQIMSLNLTEILAKNIKNYLSKEGDSYLTMLMQFANDVKHYTVRKFPIFVLFMPEGN
jgi:hypothetical protein